jgi:hypothetical protein
MGGALNLLEGLISLFPSSTEQTLRTFQRCDNAKVLILPHHPSAALSATTSYPSSCAHYFHPI